MTDSEARLIRLPAVSNLTGLGKSQIYLLAKSGKFPTPIKLSERCSAWPESEVIAWIASRISLRDAKTAAA